MKKSQKMCKRSNNRRKKRSKSRCKRSKSRSKRRNDGFSTPSSEHLMNIYGRSIDTRQTIPFSGFDDNNRNFITEWINTSLQEPLVLDRNLMVVHHRTITWLVDYVNNIKARIDFSI